jgi:Family of unknown function (DUF6496)
MCDFFRCDLWGFLRRFAANFTAFGPVKRYSGDHQRNVSEGGIYGKKRQRPIKRSKEVNHGQKVRSRYDPKASEEVEKMMHEHKHAGKFKNKQQAVAVGLEKARRKGEQVPKRKAG